jgi:hypothetical protein
MAIGSSSEDGFPHIRGKPGNDCPVFDDLGNPRRATRWHYRSSRCIPTARCLFDEEMAKKSGHRFSAGVDSLRKHASFSLSYPFSNRPGERLDPFRIIATRLDMNASQRRDGD